MQYSISDLGLSRSIYDIIIYKVLLEISMCMRKFRKYVRTMVKGGTRKGFIWWVKLLGQDLLVTVTF